MTISPRNNDFTKSEFIKKMKTRFRVLYVLFFSCNQLRHRKRIQIIFHTTEHSPYLFVYTVVRTFSHLIFIDYPHISMQIELDLLVNNITGYRLL